MAMMNEMEYRTIGSALAGGYRAAVYCRLSKDDDLQGESASIANQRDMLEKYCEKQGWEVVAVYQDDGFTGLNMERPDLQRMLRAIVLIGCNRPLHDTLRQVPNRLFCIPFRSS